MSDPSNELRDPKAIVRRGYDQISYLYRDDVGAENTGYGTLLDRLAPLIPAGSRVLDLGCGCGVPGTRQLSRDHTVLGVDISPVQIERARKLVPQAVFEVADMVSFELPSGSFDAIVSFFAVIHVPVDEQPKLFVKLHNWLVPQGWLMVSLGRRTWTGTEANWYGAEMYWSHADEATYRLWLTETGFEIVEVTFIPEGDGGHSLFLARRA